MDARRYMRELEEKDKVMTVSVLTGRGVFECKKALRHTGWDIDEAIKWLSEHNSVELTILR